MTRSTRSSTARRRAAQWSPLISHGVARRTASPPKHSAAFGRVDILVNNAGTNHLAAIDEIPDEQWDRVLELNLTAAMALSRAVVPGMRERGLGPHRPRLVDHGLRVAGAAQPLLGDQVRAARTRPGERDRRRRGRASR